METISVNRYDYINYKISLREIGEKVIYSGPDRTVAEKTIGEFFDELCHCKGCNFVFSYTRNTYSMEIKKKTSASGNESFYITSSPGSWTLTIPAEYDDLLFHRIRTNLSDEYYGNYAGNVVEASSDYEVYFSEVSWKIDNTKLYRVKNGEKLPALHSLADENTQIINKVNHRLTTPGTTSKLNETIFGQRFSYPGYAAKDMKIEGFLPSGAPSRPNDWGEGYSFGTTYYRDSGNFNQRRIDSSVTVGNMEINDEQYFSFHSSPVVLFSEFSTNGDREFAYLSLDTEDAEPIIRMTVRIKNSKGKMEDRIYYIVFDPETDKLLKYTYKPTVTITPTPGAMVGTTNARKYKDEHVWDFWNADWYWEMMKINMIYPSTAKWSVLFNNVDAWKIEQYDKELKKTTTVTDPTLKTLYKSVVRTSTPGVKSYPGLLHWSVPDRGGSPVGGSAQSKSVKDWYAITEYMNFYDGWINNHYMALEIALTSCKDVSISFIDRQYVGYHDYDYNITPKYSTYCDYNVNNKVGRETGFGLDFWPKITINMQIAQSGKMYFNLNGVLTPEWVSYLTQDNEKTACTWKYYGTGDDSHSANYNYCNYLALNADNLNWAQESYLRGGLELSLGTSTHNRVAIVLWSPNKIRMKRSSSDKWMTEEQIMELS